MTARKWPPIPLSDQERRALLALAFLVDQGLVRPPNPIPLSHEERQARLRLDYLTRRGLLAP
jgi:hypothetical protein